MKTFFLAILSMFFTLCGAACELDTTPQSETVEVAGAPSSPALTYCADTDDFARLRQVTQDAFVAHYHTTPSSCGPLQTTNNSYIWHCQGFLADVKTEIFFDRIMYGHPTPNINNMEKACGFISYLDLSTNIWRTLSTDYCNCSGCWVMFSNVDICFHPGFENGPITGGPKGGGCATAPCQ